MLAVPCKGRQRDVPLGHSARRRSRRETPGPHSSPPGRTVYGEPERTDPGRLLGCWCGRAARRQMLLTLSATRTGRSLQPNSACDVLPVIRASQSLSRRDRRRRGRRPARMPFRDRMSHASLRSSVLVVASMGEVRAWPVPDTITSRRRNPRPRFAPPRACGPSVRLPRSEVTKSPNDHGATGPGSSTFLRAG